MTANNISKTNTLNSSDNFLPENKKKKKWNPNAIKGSTNVIFNIMFIIIAFLCIFPFIFVFMLSISSEQSIRQFGYRVIPQAFSTNAYKFLWGERDTILNSFLVSVFVTIVGTALGVVLTTTMGYVLSRPHFKTKTFYTWLVFIPMIFNGGMVASYIINVNVLQLKDNIWVLILPLLVSSFNIIIAKTFFQTTIPESVIESARIDGASQFRTYLSIVVPISKPVFATIALFLTFGYWNDWFLSSLYITKRNLVSLQALLNNMMGAIEYIANNPTAGLSLTEYKMQMPSETVRMAIAVVIVIPIACAYPFFQKYFITGLTIGAVKG